MKIKGTLQTLLFLTMGYVSSSQAVTIGFDSDIYQINQGDLASLEILFDFDDESVGGTFQISFDDGILANPAFNFSSEMELDKFGIQRAVSKVDIPEAGKLNISFGTLSFNQGVSGTGSLGFLKFDTIAEGNTTLKLADVLGGFNSSTTFSRQTVSYQDTTVNVVSAVPLPASAWLFMSAFGSMIGLARKK